MYYKIWLENIKGETFMKKENMTSHGCEGGEMVSRLELEIIK